MSESERQLPPTNTDDSPWIHKNKESDDFHYRALIAYIFDGDPEKALKYFNLALDALAQGIYKEITSKPLRETDLKGAGLNFTGEGKEEWVDLAKKVAVKNAPIDKVRAVRILTGEDAQKSLQQKWAMRVAIYDDEDTNRYLLPAYFSSFYMILKSDIQYSNIYYNLEKYFSKIGETDRAQKCHEESVRFLPDEVEYTTLEMHSDFVGMEGAKRGEKIVMRPGTEFTDVYGKEYIVAPQTKEERKK